jgi:hypothetical protein
MRASLGLMLLILEAPISGQTPRPPEPPLPYESEGACPFECCTYRTWTVEADTDMLTDRKDGSAVAFRVRRGQRVEGITGVVVTSRLGRAVVRRATTIGADGEHVTIQPNEPVFVLHYIGEGYWKLWVRGRIIDEQLPDKNGGCENEAREPVECAIQITDHPEAVWWAEIRSGSRRGWTRELDHFGNIDACG